MADATFSLAWRSFHLPKQGHAPAEYEDAFAGRPAQGRFAVADGASESAFAVAWARLLVRAYVRSPGPWSRWLPAARRRWRSQLEGRDLPWYAEAKFQEGAFAALLGVAFAEGCWQAEAVGDSCLFQVRGGRLCRAFPLRRSCEFTNQPDLLGSRPRGSSRPRAKRCRLQGDWQRADVLYLMTDALAKWFLTEVEERRRPWEDWQNLQTSGHFARWVEKLRRAGEIRNDDVTLIRIQEKNS
jgi:Protein phosphatase 2C